MPHASAEARREYRRKWYARNRDGVRRYAKEWAQRNPSRVRANRAKWRARTRVQRAQYRAQNKPKFLIYHARSRARKADLAFDITVDDLVWPKRCPVFGFDLDYSASTTFVPNAPSLDRLDSNKGYVKGNVRVVSWRANELKRNASVQEIAALLAWMRREIVR